MIVKTELVNKIKDYFDLNVYETKVWLALLGKGIASAGEIASISMVPRSRTYDVLESLEKKGFAIVKLGKPVKYIGIKPRMIIEKLKNNVMKNAEEKVSVLSGIDKTKEFEELDLLYRNGIGIVKREDISASLKGRANIANYLREILENAEKEVIICANAEEVSSRINLFKQTIELLRKADIKIRIALAGSDELIKKISNVLQLKIKKINVEAKFFIIDRKEVLFYLSQAEDKEDIAVWLNSEFFSSALAVLFDKAIGTD